MKKNAALNPFFLSSDIPDPYFCDREEETKTLSLRVRGGNNVVLISSRRMGKSGLIHHLFRQKEIREHYYTFYIDIYATSSLQELIQKMGQSITGKLASSGFVALKKFLGMLASLRGEFSLDLSTGLPSFSVGLGEILHPEATLDEIFSFLEGADKPCIVAIDEFQTIANYEQKNIEATLRTRIQTMRNTSFIFAGSERSILSQMFFSYSRPFYQSASFMHLDAIERDVYADFAEKMFEGYGKKLDRNAVYDLYDLLQGYTFYMHRVLNEAFSLLPSGQVCDKDFLLARLDEILDNHTDAFQEILSSLTSNQRALLAAVAREGTATGIASSEFIVRYGLPSISSMQTAARSLLRRQLITRTPDKSYYLDDKFLELWLIRPFGHTPEFRLEQNRRRQRGN